MISRIFVVIFDSLSDKNVQNPSPTFWFSSGSNTAVVHRCGAAHALPSSDPVHHQPCLPVCTLELVSRSLDCVVHISGSCSEGQPDRFRACTTIPMLKLTSSSIYLFYLSTYTTDCSIYSLYLSTYNCKISKVLADNYKQEQFDGRCSTSGSKCARTA